MSTVQHSSQPSSALLVIDVQQGLFEKSTPIYNASDLLQNINLLIRKSRREDTPVFFVQHSSEKVLPMGSREWQLHPEIQPSEGEVIIHKCHPNAFEDTDLRAELVKRKVDRLVITGLVTHGCVKATCLGALEEGYQVVLVADAHSSYSKDAAELIRKWNHELGSRGAKVVSTQDVQY